MTDVTNANGGKPPSMTTEKQPTEAQVNALNAKLLARMKDELDKPAAPRAVVEMRSKTAIGHGQELRAAAMRGPERGHNQQTFADAVPGPSRVSDYAPPDQRPDNVTRALGPLPPYLTHSPTASPAARIASHAIGVKYEDAALECERKGLELHDRINTVLQDTLETARAFREQGAALFRQVETAFALADEVEQGNRAQRERIATVEHIEAPPELGLSDEPPPMLSDELAAKVDAVVAEARQAPHAKPERDDASFG